MSKSKDGILPLILLIAIVLSVVLIALIPLYIMYRLYKMQKDLIDIKKLINADVVKFSNIKELGKIPASTFWLDNNEKESFKQEVKELDIVNKKIASLNKQGNDAGISRNKDGTFSQRSKLGKKLAPLIDEYTDKNLNLTRSLNYLQEIPQVKWRKVDRAISSVLNENTRALKFEILISNKIEVTIYSLILWFSILLLSFPVYYFFYSGMLFNDYIMIIIVISGGLSGISYWALNHHIDGKNIVVEPDLEIYDFFPEPPPRVTLKTVDQLKKNQNIADEIGIID